MSNTLIVHTSPKELVAITATLNGTVVTSGYKVCILPLGITPDELNPAWQTPDSAAPDTGIFVGPDVARAFNAGDVAMPWAWAEGSTESAIFACPPAVQFT